jgi:CopG family nickel-responsive transcriptional regulator
MGKSNSPEALIRFGVSMEQGLLERFDGLIGKKGYNNRSEAIRDLVRAELVREGWQSDRKDQVAVLSFVYEHEHGDLMHRLTHLQHDHQEIIISTVHIHLDHDNCMEVLILKGKAAELEKLSQSILSVKGVKFGQLMHGTSGKNL